MNRNTFDLPPREFLATKGGAAGQTLLFTAMAAGTAWLTYGSVDPKFWSGFYYAELNAVGFVMNLFPVMVRVLICGAATVYLMNTIMTKLRRNADGTPILVLSDAGVSGFANGSASEHTFIGWGEFKSASTVNKSAMIFHAKPAHMLGKRATIGVSLPEIGVKYDDMVTLIEAYQAAWGLAQIQGRVLSNPQAPARAAQYTAPSLEDSAMPMPAITRRPEPQPGQFAKPNIPDFGKRMTRI